MILYILNGRDYLSSARVPENSSGAVSRLCRSSPEDGQVVASRVDYGMDRGYHGHTLKLWEGDEQRLDAGRTEGADDFDVPDGVDFI